jgi:Fe-S-cluster-containing dehydrogenase component
MAKIIFNPQRCTGCRACEGACKQENQLPVGVRWRIVSSKLTGELPNLMKTYNSRACKQCSKPKCLEVCAVNAIAKNPVNGIVTINQTICLGCKGCIEACPFGQMKFNQESNKASKCHYCQDRIQKGLTPACVKTCMTMALEWKN